MKKLIVALVLIFTSCGDSNDLPLCFSISSSDHLVDEGGDLFVVKYDKKLIDGEVVYFEDENGRYENTARMRDTSTKVIDVGGHILEDPICDYQGFR